MYFLINECFMYFCSTGFLIRFVSRFLSGSGLVPVPRVDRFDHRFGSDNIDHNTSNQWIKYSDISDEACPNRMKN